MYLFSGYKIERFKYCLLFIGFMQGINTVEQLEEKLGVELGDLIMCTFEPAATPAGSCLDIAIGLYNPYQALRREGVDSASGLYPSDVDFAYGASQKAGLIKSDTCFRVHFTGHGYEDKLKIYNVDGTQGQIPVKNVIAFRVIMKAAEVTKFYRDSIQ